MHERRDTMTIGSKPADGPSTLRPITMAAVRRASRNRFRMASSPAIDQSSSSMTVDPTAAPNAAQRIGTGLVRFN